MTSAPIFKAITFLVIHENTFISLTHKVGFGQERWYITSY